MEMLYLRSKFGFIFGFFLYEKVVVIFLGVILFLFV